MKWFVENPVITAAIITVIGSIIIAVITKIKCGRNNKSQDTSIVQNQKGGKKSKNTQIGVIRNHGDNYDK